MHLLSSSRQETTVVVMGMRLTLAALHLMAPLSDGLFFSFPTSSKPIVSRACISFIRKKPPDFSITWHRSVGKIGVNRIQITNLGLLNPLKYSLRAGSPIWASEASLARKRERGALPLAASPLARAFSRDTFNSPE